jgi:hypothetical protein
MVALATKFSANLRYFQCGKLIGAFLASLELFGARKAS